MYKMREFTRQELLADPCPTSPCPTALASTRHPVTVYQGHGFVYPWVPNGEIWIEESLDRRELPFIIAHEDIERRWEDAEIAIGFRTNRP
jgi:hypothetical protein